MAKIFLALIILLLSLPLLPFTVFAQENLQSKESVVLAKDQVINKDYFASGERVTIAGTVNGDAYIAGGNINIEGLINGDLIVAGGNLNIRGRVLGNIRATGGNITISSDIGRNVSVVGGDINFTDQAKVGGSIAVAGGNVVIFSPIEKDVTLGAGAVTLGSQIGGDVVAGVGQLTLTPNTRVGGNLTYWSEENAQIDQGAYVAGSTNHNFPPKDASAQETGRQIATALGGLFAFFKLASFISSLILGFLLLRFLPLYTQKVVDVVRKNTWSSFWVGLVAFILFPVVFIALLLTLVGIPLALLLLVLFLILMYFAKIFIALSVGQKVFEYTNQNANKYLIYTLGLLLVYIITFIPILGDIFAIVATLIAVGAILIHRKEYYKTLRSRRLI